MTRKVLIIKTGFSEFLDRGISATVSLGDVLICTSILNYFKKDKVTWVTAWEARHLLENNPSLSEVLFYGPAALKKINRTSFDVLVNLEKDVGICAHLSQVRAKERYGFYFDDKRHKVVTHKRSDRYLLSGQENHKNIDKSFLDILAETVGEKWKGEGPVLYSPKRRQGGYDIGFNHSVGTKWPTKAWPMEHWKSLEERLSKKYTISWQQGHNNLRQYIDWIARCRLLVTSDSLGQAIGFGLGKQVITLYGPTNERRMSGIKNIQIVSSPLKCPFRPCYQPQCQYSRFCMAEISVEQVAEICERKLS
jgi:heptosyltransferase II